MTDENLRRSVRAIGILQYFISVILLAAGVTLLCAAFFLESDSRAQLGRGLVGICVIALAVFYFLLARSLRQFKSWARLATMIISCIGLLGVPFGTVINAAFLYVLIKGRHLFQDSAEMASVPPIMPIDR